MEYTYEILNEGTIGEIILRSDGASIPKDLGNSDYQRYLNPEESIANEASAK
jgi:hypothetical protein